MEERKTIMVEVVVNAPLETVWSIWIDPQHTKGWAFASDDWEALGAENDFRVGGKFKTTMAAKDNSASFDFTGTYTTIAAERLIDYVMDDGRKVTTHFEPSGAGTKVIQTFDMEQVNTEELQRNGWQAILDNFKKYVESLPN